MYVLGHSFCVIIYLNVMQDRLALLDFYVLALLACRASLKPEMWRGLPVKISLLLVTPGKDP